MALSDAFKKADELGAQGRYFDAHEELEAFWMKASGDEKVLLQGLIQVAAGLHRLKINAAKPTGAFYLLDRGREKLLKTKSLLEPKSLASLDASLLGVRASGKAPGSLVFGLRPA